MTMTGAEAAIRWGYHLAASLTAWTVTSGEAGVCTLTASVVSPDHFRLSQRPLVFVVVRQGVAWRWPIVELLQHVDGALTARLGPMES